MSTMVAHDHAKQDSSRAAANRAFGRKAVSLIPPSLQAKLVINTPKDRYEQEADSIADHVMSVDAPVQAKISSISSLQRKCAHCEAEEKDMQRKEMSGEEMEAGSDIEAYVGNLGNTGASLPEGLRDFYEPRFNHDFSQVKVHTDTAAAKSARAVNALAYTSGNHIVFNEGQYSPETDNGKRLLAHELTHVIQQGGNGMFAQAKFIQRAGTCAEEPPRIPHHLLVNGSVHPDVREVQRKLVIFSNNEVAAGRAPLPNMPLVDDCIYGSKTTAAVLEFQKRVFPAAPGEWDGKVGDHTWAEIDAVAPAPGPGPIPLPPVPPPPPAASITSETVVTSPGARTRTTIGVGEEVNLTHSAGTPTTAWTKTAGELSSLTGATVKFTAPDTAQTVTITAGGATIVFTILAPTSLVMDRFPGTGVKHTGNQPDVGIQTLAFLGPDTVNFKNVVYREIDVLAVSSGTYSCHNGIAGHCGTGSGPCGDLFPVDRIVAGKGTQGDAQGDCAYSGHCNLPAPFVPGSLSFLIPYEYKVGTGSFHRFSTVLQMHTLAADASSLTTDKAGAHGDTTVAAATSTAGACG